MIFSKLFIYRALDQHFSHRCARLEDTFKWNREAKNVKVSLQIHSFHHRSYDTSPLVNLALSLIILPWLSTGGLISQTARRQDAIMYNELLLKCLPGQILAKIFYPLDVCQMMEYSRSTDRHPKLNATESRSIKLGFSFPSFRYRSGRYAIGLSKVFGLCNMDLIKKIRTKSRCDPLC